MFKKILFLAGYIVVGVLGVVLITFAWTEPGDDPPLGNVTLVKWNAGTGDTIYRLNGNVGIGTTTPDAPVHIDRDWVINQGTLKIQGATNGYSGITLFEDTIWSAYLAYDGANNDLVFQNQSGGSYGDLLLNPSGGNVGIGTTTPGQKLTVNGTIGFAGGAGPFCIFANGCPNGWIDRGAGGYIRDNTGSCPYSGGSAFNATWTWCHPRICCIG